MTTPWPDLPPALAAFLQAHADGLDEGDAPAAAELLPQLAGSGLFGLGVPVALGGAGGRTADGLLAIAAVARQSLAAAFVFWGQRAFIEYLLQSENAPLRERWLTALLQGRVAGATGLSNAMKFLSGLEPLGVQAHAAEGKGWQLQGRVPWATNLQPQRFIVAVAVDRTDGGGPFVAALPHDRAGLARSDDLDLIGLRGTATAALQIGDLPLEEADLLAADARAWLPRVRPAFLGLQCGLSIGLAQAALASARAAGVKAKSVLGPTIARAEAALDQAVAELCAGVDDGRFVTRPVPMFELRIRLAEVVAEAVQLELQAAGGRAYHRGSGGFARRWRESAFIPIVTPSVSQLQGELLKHRAAA